MKLQIVQYGDPVLRAKGEPVRTIDAGTRALAADMLETMRDARGVGLAAQQVGQALQLTVVDVSQVEDRPSSMRIGGQEVDPNAHMPLVLINPEITLGRENEASEEGCLSFPEITGEIERSRTVSVRAQDLEGATVTFEADGLLARAIQHEVDHLNGILFIDRMNSAAKVTLASRLRRLQKETQRGIRHKQSAVREPAL
jgi:peptide deformylase